MLRHLKMMIISKSRWSSVRSSDAHYIGKSAENDDQNICRKEIAFGIALGVTLIRGSFLSSEIYLRRNFCCLRVYAEQAVQSATRKQFPAPARLCANKKAEQNLNSVTKSHPTSKIRATSRTIPMVRRSTPSDASGTTALSRQRHQLCS